MKSDPSKEPLFNITIAGTPTIKDLIGDLNGGTVFSKLDLNQVELAPKSRYITTFGTHLGLIREWTEKHNRALVQLKNAFANAPGRAYFDPSRPTELSVDASPVGLGASVSKQREAAFKDHPTEQTSYFSSSTIQTLRCPSNNRQRRQ